MKEERLLTSEEIIEVLENAEEITKKLRGVGFAYACLDLRGFKSGSLNEGIFDEKKTEKDKNEGQIAL